MTTSRSFRTPARAVTAVVAAGLATLVAIDVAGAGNDDAGCARAAATSAACTAPASGSDLAPLRGADAVARLGDRLPEAAIANGMTPAALSELLAGDITAWVDGDDRVFFAEPAATGEPGEAPTAVDYGGTLLSYVSSADAFTLSSRPDATRSIYLDFTGHSTTGTSWNSSTLTTIESAPFDLDGIAGFGATEHQRIREIWAAVSEDFAAYDVNVTTVDPTPVDGLRKTTTSDSAYGVRVVVSPTNWYNLNAGGVAYIGSFSWNSDTPAFVFTQQLGSSSYKTVAEAISHEAGHTLGLRHDGYNADSYYMGHGTWAPIMGVGYYKATTQWSRGEYAGATNTEDDLVVMQSHTPLLADDHGDTAASATALSTGAATAGYITTRTDVDLFSIATGGGPITLTAVPAAPSADLDIQLSLLSSDLAPITVANPDGAGTVTFTQDLPAGTYLARVDGAGTGDPSTGYSDYASIGRYTLTATFTGGTTTTTTTTVAPTTTTTTLAPTTTTSTTTTTTTTTTVAQPILHVASVTVRRGTTTLSAVASVTVVDASGRPVAGATVTGTWSGQAKGTGTAVTDANGLATMPQVTVRRTGKVAFGVSSVSMAGARWDGVTVAGSTKI